MDGASRRRLEPGYGPWHPAAVHHAQYSIEPSPCSVSEITLKSRTERAPPWRYLQESSHCKVSVSWVTEAGGNG